MKFINNLNIQDHNVDNLTEMKISIISQQRSLKKNRQENKKTGRCRILCIRNDHKDPEKYSKTHKLIHNKIKGYRKLVRRDL